MNNEMLKQGFVNFSISVKKNPALADETSYIRFMFQENLGGVLMSAFKEAGKMRFEAFNPMYGGAQITCSVKELLQQPVNDGFDISIFWKDGEITWTINHQNFGPTAFDFELSVGDVAPFFVAGLHPDYRNLDNNAVLYGEVLSIKDTDYQVRFTPTTKHQLPITTDIPKSRYAQLRSSQTNKHQ